MGKTIAEKIIAEHSEVSELCAGDIVQAKVDLLMGNDISGSMAVNIFAKLNNPMVFDKEKIALIADHFTPNKDIKSAEQAKVIRDFARKYALLHFYENEGIEHALLPEKGLVKPGQLIGGADSHTPTYGALGAMAVGIGATDLGAAMLTGWIWLKVPETLKVLLKGSLLPWVTGKDIILYLISIIGVDGANYKAIEFQGEGISSLPMESRFTIANMTAEAGAKTAFFPVDDVCKNYIKDKAVGEYSIFTSDSDAGFCDTLKINLDDVGLQVAVPHQPSNVKHVNDVKDLNLDQVVIGSCTNGWLEDLRVAAEIIKGKKVKPGLRLIVIPATRSIYKQALDEGYISTFTEAGGVVSPPTCGPCLGGHMGILAKGERALATTNRNFVGRMGDKGSEVFLAGPAVAAASAIAGKITHPDQVIG